MSFYNTMGNYIDYGSQTLNSLALLPFGQANQVLMMNAADNAVIFGGGTAGPGTVQSITSSDSSLTVTGGTGPNTSIIINTNHANTWNAIQTFASGIYSNSGSTASPSYSFIGDTDTGIIDSAPNEISLIGGGTALAVFNNSSSTFNNQVNTTKYYDINNRRFASLGKAQDTTSVFIGDGAGGAATADVTVTGANNVAIGVNSLRNATSATQNACYGISAGQSITTGNFNTAIGAGALQSLTTGSTNVAIGSVASSAQTTASDVISIGRNSNGANTTGNNIVSIGSSAGITNNSNFCTNVGSFAAQFNTGSNTTTLGYHALTSGSTANPTAASSTFITAIGDNTSISGSSLLTNSSCLGSGSIIANSNEVVLGNSLVDTVRSGSTGGFASLGSSTYPYGNVYANALNNGSTLSIPNIASTIASLGGNQVFTGTDDFTNSISVLDTNFIIKNSSDNTKHLDFNVGPNSSGKILQINCNQSTNQTINIPNITTTDTFATLGLGEVFTGGCTFSNNLIVTGKLDLRATNYIYESFTTVSLTSYTIQPTDRHIIFTNSSCSVLLPNPVNYPGRYLSFSCGNGTGYGTKNLAVSGNFSSGSFDATAVYASDNTYSIIFFDGLAVNALVWSGWGAVALYHTVSGSIISNGANWMAVI